MGRRATWAEAMLECIGGAMRGEEREEPAGGERLLLGLTVRGSRSWR